MVLFMEPLVTVVGGYATARYLPGLGPVAPWVVATCYGAILGTFMLTRWRRRGWLTIHLEAPADSAKLSDLPLTTDPAV